METATKALYNTTMIRVGVGQSVHDSPEKAAREAARMAMKRAGLRRADLALVFASAAYHPNYPLLLKALRNETDADHRIGCSALGVITSDGEWETPHAVAVMVISSDTLSVAPFLLHPLHERGDLVGRTLGRMAADAAHDEPSHSSLAIVLPDTYNFQSEPFIKEFHKAADRTTMAGGGASEDGSLMQTFQMYQDQVLSDAVAGFILNGPFTHTIGLAQACHPIGNPMMVTRGGHNTIYELAGRPALEWYTKLFAHIPPERVRAATGLVFVGFPADSAETRFHRGSYLIRNVMGVDPREGSITIPDAVEEGQVISFMLREPGESARDMETVVSELAKIHHGRPPSLALYFNCCGRGRSLYGSTGVDHAIIKKYFGDIPLIGFFTYSEIAPIHGITRFHNYSGVLVLIGE